MTILFLKHFFSACKPFCKNNYSRSDINQIPTIHNLFSTIKKADSAMLSALFDILTSFAAAAGTAAAASFFSDDTAQRSCKPNGNPANYHIIQKTHVSPSLYVFPNQTIRKTDSVPDKSRRKPAMRPHTAEAPLLQLLFVIQALCGPLQSQPHTGYTAA